MALATRFEAERPRLRALARRMLGSAAEAEDAVQESWLRLAAAPEVDNLAAWPTTVVSRICLDVLRARRETPVEQLPDRGVAGPEDDVALADEVGRALLMVLAALAPAERVAFGLHDLFAVPFDAIGPILDCTPATAKKLASRARLRVRGTPARISDTTGRSWPRSSRLPAVVISRRCSTCSPPTSSGTPTRPPWHPVPQPCSAVPRRSRAAPPPSPAGRASGSSHWSTARSGWCSRPRAG